MLIHTPSTDMWRPIARCEVPVVNPLYSKYKGQTVTFWQHKGRSLTNISSVTVTNAYFSKPDESNYIQMNLSASAQEIITIACSGFTWLPCCEIPTPSSLQANQTAAPKTQHKESERQLHPDMNKSTTLTWSNINNTVKWLELHTCGALMECSSFNFHYSNCL